ncbi:MAG: PadR family transcriptional regulator [Acidobacteria bacterium]|nr:PadR family transcriptional regulator [Acidobacteriota bacterium]
MSNTNLKQIDFLVLAVLRKGPLHGYGIVRQLDALTDGAVQLRPGDVYRVLYRMEKARLLQEAGEGSTESGRRTNYAITDAGRQMLASQAEILASVAAGVLAAEGTDNV